MPSKSKKSSLVTKPKASVDYVRKEVADLKPRWDTVRDCVAGQLKIKAERTKYLPAPQASDKSTENADRYLAYLTRAVFYNVTGYTLAGLLGQVFKSDPKVEVSKQLEILEADADGGGVSLSQQSQMTLAQVLQFGRCGLLVDYPTTAAPTSVADADAGKIRPRIILWQPWDIINWRTVTVGGKVMLSLVVISERYVVDDDGFAAETDCQYRVLKLVEGRYVVEIWRTTEDTPAILAVAETFTPLNSAGVPWDFIPFTFVGAVNNDSSPDLPPLYDMAELNVAHYRNSADFEEACYMVGQPTPWVAGVDKAWVKDVWGGKLMLGSRTVISLPVNGTAGLLQVQENTLPMEAMKHKEEQMKALGAKLILPGEVQKTATQAGIEDTSQTCILAQCANNVSAAYTQALEWAGLFVGETGKPEFVLNVDFQAALSNAQDRAELVAEWQAQAITTSEMRSQLREIGVATLDDEKYQQEIADAGPNNGLPVDPNQQVIDTANATAAVATAKAKLKQADAPPAPAK